MLTTTLRNGLEAYQIGDKLRALRQEKEMGLVELGRHAGLSPAMLSKIERGRLFPTLPTLLRIALVFGVGLDFFFLGARDKPLVGVVRRRERLRFPERPGQREPAFLFESLDFSAPERRLNAYLAEFFPVAAGRATPHRHPGGEFIYVLSGTLVVGIGRDEHLLDAQDSMYFDSGVPHSYKRRGGRPCTAVVVTTR